MDTIKKIWAGPFTVKLSLIFILFVLLVMFISNPGLMLFGACVIFSVSRIIDWLCKDD